MTASLPPDRAERLTDHEDVAAALRAEPPALDDLARARLERAILHAPPQKTQAARAPRALLVGGALAAAAAALIVVVKWPADAPTSGATAGTLPAEVAAPAPVARFEVRESQALARRGTIEAGSVLPTAAGEQADIRIADSRVRIAPSSRVRIAELTRDRLDLELASGEIRVEFHPRERGREHLTVETAEARVEVVGTVFTVRALEGRTEVAVEEGVVRVVSRHDGAARELRAGERATTVRAERAVDEAAPDVAVEPAAPEPPAGRATTPAPDPAAQLAHARRLVAAGASERAAPMLTELGEQGPPRIRAQALTLLADLDQRDGRLEAAAERYARAAELGRGTQTGPNALYALARLEERRLADRPAAARAYRQYLADAPDGPLADQARQALCRLGEEDACAPR